MPNLAEWLERYRQEKGNLVPKGESLRRSIERARSAAGIEEWAQDCLRHSFATYHLALFHNAPLTAHELGHSNPDTLYRHYRNLATQEQGRKFFEIMPRNCQE